MPSLKRLSLGGAAPIALGLAVSGLSTVAMVMMSSRVLSSSQLAVFMTWWITVTFLVTAFGVFEVYLARSWLAARSEGSPTAPVVAQLSGQLCLLVLVIALISLTFAGPLSEAFFGGQMWAPLLIPAYGGVWALLAVQRGVATGQLRFGLVGTQLAAEGLLRAALTGLALLLPTSQASSVALATVAAGGLAALGTGAWLGGWLVVPAPMSRALSIAPLLWLLLGSVGPILIGNIVVPWFAWVEPDDPAMLAAFAGAMTLSRMPTQFVSAAFSPMMAALSASADRGDWSGHGRLLTRALRLAWILGVAFVVVFVVAGQWVLRIYLGPSYSVPASTLGLLALSSAGVFFATVQQASLAARLQWAWIALAWGLATVMFAGVLLLPVSALVRASLAPAIAVGGAVAVNSARLRQNRLRSVASDQR